MFGLVLLIQSGGLRQPQAHTGVGWLDEHVDFIWVEGRSLRRKPTLALNPNNNMLK